jgi:hypothetical protein
MQSEPMAQENSEISRSDPHRGGPLMSLALALFESLCEIANNLSAYRDRFAPCSDDWTAVTCLLLALDAAIDRLVRSDGFEQEDTP